MAKCCKVYCKNLAIWFDSIQEAADFAGAKMWTMSKKMAVSGSFIDKYGNEYVRERPMKTKNQYKDTGNKLCKKWSRKKKEILKQERTTSFGDLPAPVQRLINEKISEMLLAGKPYTEIKKFMLEMGCKKLIINLTDV
jgi:hypothetical protein